MHTPYLHRRGLRRTAWLMLVAWLWALTAGVVNGCMLAAHGPDGPQDAFESHLPSAVYADSLGARSAAQAASQDLPVAHHGDEQNGGKDVCLKFCDDESSALWKNKTATFDPGAMLAYAVEPWKPIGPVTRVEPSLSVERPASIGPPLVIRFLRLTL